MRDYRHLSGEGVTLAVDVRDGFARVALAACSDEDVYSPETGRDIVDILLDKGDTTLRALSLSRNVVRFPYKGDKPRRDIINPLINHMGDGLGERGFFRALKSFFDSGVVCNKDAVALSRELNDDSICINFVRTMEVMDEGAQEIFAQVETEEELYLNFFPWQANVGSLVRRMKDFSSKVWSKEIELGKAPVKSPGEPKRIALRKPVEAVQRAIAATPVKAEEVSAESS